jgi:uncharacterized protein
MEQRFNILSLSGGGFLGLYTIAVLAGLEMRSGRPIARSFDLIAGTSIGGIVALGLAAEIPAADIQQAFERNGEAIFSDRAAPSSTYGNFRDMMRFALKAKYSGTALRETISNLVGEDTKIGDLKHRVIVPAVNLTKGLPQIFKTPHHQTFVTDLHLKVVDVAMATSAAPTYFPVAEIGDNLFADGGLYANSPDLLALHEAEHFLSTPTGNVNVLSVGTTTSQFSFAHAGGLDLGIVGWTKEQRLVNAMIASQQQSVDYMMRHKLGDGYLRLDATQSREQERHLALDVATKYARKTIRGLAASTVQNTASDGKLLAFLAHEAPEPAFPGKGA